MSGRAQMLDEGRQFLGTRHRRHCDRNLVTCLACCRRGAQIAEAGAIEELLGTTLATGVFSRSTVKEVAEALGETTALFGGVYYQIVGDYALWVAGIVVMLVSFALFPVPRGR